MQSIRWGLLSTANINRRLIPAIRASKRGELVAVASRDQDQANAYAAKWEIPGAFGGYQEMLSSGAIDAVYIGLPNHLHAEWSIKAMQAGIHVLCEKPFATSLEEVDRMVAASRETGRVLAEAFMYRHHPQTKIVGQWVREGRLGDISLVRGTFNFILDDQHNVRLVPEYGGGCLWDIGVYPLSFAQYIYGGPPQKVYGTSWTGSTGVDMDFAGQMCYPGGGVAQISASFRSDFYIQAEIIGALGRMAITKPFTNMEQNPQLTFYPNQGKPQAITVPTKELYLGEVEDMHAAILDGAPSYLTLTETRDHVRTVLALYESAAAGQSIRL